MIFGSLFKEKKEELCLLVNVGNSNVTGALAKFQKDKLPKFVGTSKISFPVVDIPTEKRLVLGMIESLDALLSGLLKGKVVSGGGELSHVLISFSSPWFTMKSTNVNISQPKSFLVTNSLLQHILQEQEGIFVQELREAGDGTSFSILEKDVLHLRLNGYEINDIAGKKTSELGLSVCMSAIPEDIMRKVKNIIVKHIHINDDRIITHSFPKVFFSAIRDEFPKNLDTILMDVTGEMTDLILVNDGAINKTVTFPFGKNFLVRQVAKRFDVSMEIAESTLNMYVQKKTSDSVVKKLEVIIEDMEKEWAIYLEDALLTLSPTLALPKRIHVRANSDTAPIFLEFLKLQKNDKTASFRTGLVVDHLNRDRMIGKYEAIGGIQVSEISVILALFHKKQNLS